MIISKFEILKNKKTDAYSNLAKIKAWSEITLLFNAQSIVKKTADQLKTIFRNKKGEIRKDLAIDNAERFKTGGGPYQQRVSDTNPFMSFVQESCTPQSGVVDSDTPINRELICDDDDDVVFVSETKGERNHEVIPDTVTDPQPSTSFSIKQEKENTHSPALKQIPALVKNIKKRKAFVPLQTSRASKIVQSQSLKDDILQQHKYMQDTKQKILNYKLKYWEAKSNKMDNKE